MIPNAATSIRDISRNGQNANNPLQESAQVRGWLPRIMTTERAKAQGVFIPNWWLAILLIPLAGGVLWMVMTLTSISANQASMKDTLEYRLKQVETQTKLNDEHERQRQIDQARLEGEIDALTKMMQRKPTGDLDQ